MGAAGAPRWLRALARRVIVGSSPDRTQELIDQGILTLGRHTYDAPSVAHYRGDDVAVRIGHFCSIGKDVELLPGGNHRIDAVTTFPLRIKLDLPGAYEDGMPWSKGDIVVQNDVWIGRGAKILGGLTIGNGAVIGAYAVVTGDVAPYEIVAGNPARHVRWRFDTHIIDALTRIAWWDWSDDVIRARVGELSSADLRPFIAKYDPAIGTDGER